MDRLCPFLALADDRRTVVDGFDAEHRCHATTPSLELDRARQASLCLTEAHRDCERYVTALQRHAAGLAAPPPAPDAVIARTRLVLDPAPGGRLMLSGRGPAARRWALGGALATVGVVAVATGAAGALGGLVGGIQRAGPSASQAAARTQPAAPTARPSQAPLIAPATVEQAPTVEPSPTAAPVPATATPAPAYVVQAGDTLDGIATRFGTTVAALIEANGLASADLINVGQKLLIPAS
ncbi:MAG: LysM peptidoglycan-binding domain-containing protein [Candidatus Limnocylindria bacterium]